MKKPVVDQWEGCYPSRWKDLIVPNAIKHPAKFSSKLIARIYDHMIAQGWVQPGDIVLDPFGGVGLGAFDAMRLGLRWRGIELEANFADLGNQNIALWNRRFSRMPHWCQDAVLFHGDSRKLLSILQEADGAVSSPPWTNTLSDDNVTEGRVELARERGISNDEHITPIEMEKIGKRRRGYSAAGAVSSPPYAEARIGQESGQEQCGRGDQYGATDGQLGAMRAEGFDAAVSSPPFLQARGGTNPDIRLGRGDPDLIRRHAAGNAAAHAYGESEGQLSSMKDDGFDGAVTSPPFQGQSADGGWQMLGKYAEEGKLTVKQVNGDPSKSYPSWAPDRDTSYGHADGQLADAGDSFWLSARAIVDQVYAALKPGAHAVWVVKGFVKNHHVVDFPGQWRQLCEAAGFETVHIHHAMLTNKRGASYTLDGGTVKHDTEAKSFFRRNGENKARAKKWWDTCDLSRDCKAEYLWKAKREKWVQWITEVLKHQEDGRVIKKPKAFIVRGLAQMMAYRDAGEPEIEIETSIDYETVLCMQKPEGV